MIRPLPFVWPYAGAFWIVFLWAFAPEFAITQRARKASGRAEDAGSLRLILVGQAAAMCFAFLSAAMVPRASLHSLRLGAFWGGTAMLVAGALVRRHCFRVLGRFFTGAVMVQEGQMVIDRGAYRWVRHPSYTGGMVMFAGIGFALGNWISIALLAVIPLLVYSYRVQVEERALLQQLGQPYRDYMGRSKRFIPFVI